MYLMVYVMQYYLKLKLKKKKKKNNNLSTLTLCIYAIKYIKL
jgi:hypothetical protein